MGAALLVPGIFFLVQRQTGIRADATVADCEITGAGRLEDTHCTGSWVVGGSLLDGGHVVLGTISGAEQSDVGKKLDVTVNGDTAYTRELATPLVLIGLGLIPCGVMLLFVMRLVRLRNGA
jgi:hypothetical protein